MPCTPSRVGIRRLRATLSTFGGVYRRVDRGLPRAGGEVGRSAARRCARPPGARRALRRRSTEPRGGVSSSPTTSPAERSDAWKAATAGLSGARGVALFAQLERWREDPPFSGKAERPAYRAFAPIEKADKRVRSRLERARAAAASCDEDAGDLLHDARKAAKRHRYAVELARSVVGADAEQMIEARQSLQDALGAHQDAVVALAFLREIDVSAQNAETDPPAGDAHRPHSRQSRGRRRCAARCAAHRAEPG